MTQKYDPWVVQKIKEILDAFLMDEEDIIKALIEELEKGLQYGRETPGSIDKTLISVAEGVLEPLQAIYGEEDSDSPAQNFSVDELKNVLSKRKKDKVIKKMSGSLDMLKNFDDD